jgi:hypothetical protein
MAGDQVLALLDTARCRSLRVAPRADDMHARSRRAIGLPEVQEGREAAPRNAAPACAAPAPPEAGRLIRSPRVQTHNR